jgi:hypothetical protein
VFDGTSFTEVGDLGTAVRDVQCANNPSQGIANALNFGGFSTVYTSVTETWTAPSVFSKTTEGQLFFNSTTNTFKETILDVAGGSWASGTDLSTARSFHAMAATSSDAAIAFGGNPGATANTEQYDGSSWTEKNNLNTGGASLRGFGTVSAAIAAAGYDTASMNQVES